MKRRKPMPPPKKPMARSGLKQRSKKRSTRVYLVENGVKTMPDGREVCDLTKTGRAEYLLRTFLMAQRQAGLCAICQQPFDRFSDYYMPTFEHQDGRGMGGAHRDDRITINGEWYNAAIHMKCQSKGSVRYAWVDGRFVPKERAA